MDISAINGTSAASQAVTTKNDMVGKDEFFELLITQLSNQDPLNPMEDRDFITQLAQFSTLEGMQELNTGFNELRGISMLGRTVAATRDASGEYQSDVVIGMVEGVSHSGDRIMLNLGEESVYLDNVKIVEQTFYTEPETTEETTDE